MPHNKRSIHRHNIRVVLTGPVDGLSEAQKDRLMHELTRVLTDRGFKGDSQRTLTLTPSDEFGSQYKLQISVSDAVADMSETLQWEAIEKGLVDVVKSITQCDVLPVKKFVRHPAPAKEPIVV